MSPLMIAGLVAVFVVFALITAMLIFKDYSGSKSIEERLGRVTGVSTPTLESSGILRSPMFPEEERSTLQKMLPRLPNIQKLFDQADFQMKPQMFWALSMLLAFAGVLIPVGARLPLYLAPIFALVLGMLPMLYVMYLRGQRLSKFGAQLCEALELVARALRAGHSLAAAMHTVAEEMPNPIAKEFGRVYEEQNLGLGLEQAMRNLVERVPNMDLKFFVTAVIIQRQTGGDLAEILDKIGYLIRERFKILGMVKALTAEGRLSGIILIALPFGLFFMLLRMNPDYVKLLWTHQLGQKMCAYGIGSMIVCALAIRKIINIKV